MSDRKLRLFELAKELNVPSKSIIEKCKAEGIEVKTHMHPMSAGLEATVREWFSEGAHSTTAEEATRVDLEIVRKAARPRKKAASKKDDEGGVAVMEPQQAEHAADIGVAAEAPELAEGRVSESTAGIVEVREVAEAPVAAPIRPPEPAVAPHAPEAPSKPVGSPVVVEKPSAAAGPQNVPQPARLAGPKLIRMDRPEEVARPRPMPRPAARGPYGGGPPSGPVPPKTDDPRGRRGPIRDGARPGAPVDEAPGPAGDRKRTHPRRGDRDFDKSGEILREWRDRDLIERRERISHASGRGIAGMRAVEATAPARRGFQPAPAKKTTVELSEPIVIKDFSRESGITVVEIVKRLMENHGTMAGTTSVIDSEIAQTIAAEFGLELVITKAKSALDRLSEEFAALPRKHIETRPPIVTVLGHVDHGKTSLLDRIRKTNVAAGEAGGITQHIGAYRVKVGERWVTFLDTPGHTAFTAMRARGANLTDVVVLVVAADDGVMPTTIEAINHARAAGTPIVVALNKSDLPHDINKIYGQLSQHGLTPSGDWGGDTDVIKTSALTGAGVEDLLTHLATLSDVLDLKADATIPATGRVIEAQRSEGSGNVARLMVQEGTLKPGHFLVCGSTYGKVRAIKDDNRKTVNKAGPSTPVEVMGLNELPQAGDQFFGVPSLQMAKDAAEELSLLRRQAELARASAKPKTLETMLASAAEGVIPTLNVILRADVQGSVDVLEKTLSEFPTNQVRLVILNKGVGAITESDVVLAQASEALIIGFYVLPEPSAARLADESQVPIRTYRVIYEVLDDIKKALEDRLPPEEKIESRGRAEVREVFHISKLGKVAGCIVRDGAIARNHMMRVIRDAVVVKENAPVASLKRFKDDAREVKAGLECGIKLGGFDDVKPGDVLEAYEIVKTARTLD